MNLRQALADALEPLAMLQLARDLAELTDVPLSELESAAIAPAGSPARYRLTRMADEYRGAATAAIGRPVLWSETVRWHRARRSAS